MRFAVIPASIIWLSCVCLLPALEPITPKLEKPLECAACEHSLFLENEPSTTLQGPKGEGPTKSQYERDKGRRWIDLLGRGLGYWRRVPIRPGEELKEGNPWSYDEKNRRIICKAGNGDKQKGYHELLLYDYQFGDGIFHVEWRLKKQGQNSKYNSGIYVRTAPDASRWHQAQVGDRNVGYFLGVMKPGAKRYGTKLTGPQRGKPAGEWNTFEITCQGKEISLWVNGYRTAKKMTAHKRGQIGIQAEFYDIEFKNLKWKYLSNEK